MRVIKSSQLDQEQSLIRDVLLNRGGSVVYPTETFYAIGCVADQSAAVKRVYQLKERELTAPLLILINSWKMAEAFIDFTDDVQTKFLKKHWPGALTAILSSRRNLAPELNLRSETLGFRMTASEEASTLIDILNIPLVGTSANLSGHRAISSFEEVQQVFHDKVDLLVDGGSTPGGAASTIIDMSDGTPYRIIRQGRFEVENLG